MSCYFDDILWVYKCWLDSCWWASEALINKELRQHWHCADLTQSDGYTLIYLWYICQTFLMQHFCNIVWDYIIYIHTRERILGLLLSLDFTLDCVNKKYWTIEFVTKIKYTKGLRHWVFFAQASFRNRQL